MIRLLKDTMSIERAHMRLSLALPRRDAKKAREMLMSHIASVERENWEEGNLEMVISY